MHSFNLVTSRCASHIPSTWIFMQLLLCPHYRYQLINFPANSGNLTITYSNLSISHCVRDHMESNNDDVRMPWHTGLLLVQTDHVTWILACDWIKVVTFLSFYPGYYPHCANVSSASGVLLLVLLIETHRSCGHTDRPQMGQSRPNNPAGHQKLAQFAKNHG